MDRSTYVERDCHTQSQTFEPCRPTEADVGRETGHSANKFRARSISSTSSDDVERDCSRSVKRTRPQSDVEGDSPIKIPRVFNSVHDQSLYLATSKDKIEEAIFLLAQGANPNYIFPEPPRYSTLHKACYNNNSQLIKELLKHDVLNTINLKTINGYTPLHIACVFGHIQCIKLLLESCICNTGNFV